MKSNSTFGLARLFTAFAAAIMLLAVPSCEKAQPEEGEQPLPPITPLPQPELPEEVEDSYDETKILSHVQEFLSSTILRLSLTKRRNSSAVPRSPSLHPTQTTSTAMWR